MVSPSTFPSVNVLEPAGIDPGELSPERLQVERYVVKGLKSEEIAQLVPFGASKVHKELGKLYKLFGVANKDLLEAKLTPDDSSIEGKDITRLTVDEFAMFEMAAHGLINAEIVRRMKPANPSVTNSKVADYKTKINGKFGTSGPVQFARVGFAYEKKTREAAHQVKDATEATLQKVEDLSIKRPEVLKLNGGSDFKVRDKKQLEWLYQNDFIDGKMERTGRIDLAGFLALTLRKNKAISKLLSDQHTGAYAQEVINQEVELFIKRKTASRCGAG